jgi:hypothetical protein
MAIWAGTNSVPAQAGISRTHLLAHTKNCDRRPSP